MLEKPAKYHDAIADIKSKCKCGHTKVIPVYVDRILCNYCGHWIYRYYHIRYPKGIENIMAIV